MYEIVIGVIGFMIGYALHSITNRNVVEVHTNAEDKQTKLPVVKKNGKK